MPDVIIDGERYAANQNERLSDVIRRAGKALTMPCGGRGTCGKCRVHVNGEEALACEYEVVADVTVVLPEKERIVSETGAGETFSETDCMALALDIGTTTLALALVSLDERQIVRVVTETNPQRSFGADVMSRIAYSKEHGVTGLQLGIVTAVNAILQSLGTASTDTMYVAGNTTMLHLFFGVDPSSMGAAPYIPVFLEGRTVSGASLGIPRVKNVTSLPSAAAFVGADLTAGLYYVGMPDRGKHRLLIDLGTNAEILLFSSESVVCTAAAAGPCFEGANISCGMSASPGAIYAYGDDGYKTIQGAPAKGVCGTGLVDLISFLLKKGIIDETGYMEERFEVAPGVTLTQGDVRQYQLAKSAVRAALETLLQKQGLSFDAIDKLYISGGFAAKINIDSAVATGLLPSALRNRCIAVNNSSLLGTVKALCEAADLSSLTAKMNYVDLSADAVFSDFFIDYMSFEEDGR